MLTGQAGEADKIQGLEAGRQRLCREAVPLCGAAGAGAGASAPARAERGRDVCDRALHVQAGVEAAGRRQANKIRLTEKETSILKYLYRAGEKVVDARRAAARGVGL